MVETQVVLLRKLRNLIIGPYHGIGEMRFASLMTRDGGVCRGIMCEHPAVEFGFGGGTQAGFFLARFLAGRSLALLYLILRHLVPRLLAMWPLARRRR